AAALSVPRARAPGGWVCRDVRTAVVAGAARGRPAPLGAFRLVPDPADRGGEGHRRKPCGHQRDGVPCRGAGAGGGAVTAQLQLLPCSPPSQRLERVELERLDGFADAKPSRELREQLRTLGLLQAIVAVPARDGRFR